MHTHSPSRCILLACRLAENCVRMDCADCSSVTRTNGINLVTEMMRGQRQGVERHGGEEVEPCRGACIYAHMQSCVCCLPAIHNKTQPDAVATLLKITHSGYLRARSPRTKSLSVPANSTPVGPPPTTAKCSTRRRASSLVPGRAASSNTSCRGTDRQMDGRS